MTQPRSHAPRVGPAVVMLAFVGLAILSGLASAVLPGSFIFALLLVPAVATLALVRPEYALAACLALVYGLIHPMLVPRLPVFGGALAAADAVLVLLVCYVAWVLATQRGPTPAAPVAGARLVGGSLALFSVWFVLAVLFSLTMREIAPARVLGETRDLMYAAVLPLAVVILREQQRQERFVIALVVLGSLFSLGQLAQGLFGIPVFGTSGISNLETLGFREYSTTRSNTNGLSVIIFALFLTIGAHALGVLRRGLFLPLFGLLTMGILLTYGRTTFATVVLCLLVLMAWLNLKALPRLAAVSAVFLLVVAALGYAFKPASIEALVFRLTSVSEELRHGHSANFRYQEVDAMLPHIAQHPLTGLGLGADYKGLSGSSVRDDLNRYVHNAYLYMAGKMGVPALLLYLLMMVAILILGRRLAKSDAPPWVRVVGAASAVMMIRFWVSSITEPHLMSDHGVATIAVCGALVLLAARRASAAPPRPAARSRLVVAGRPR